MPVPNVSVIVASVLCRSVWHGWSMKDRRMQIRQSPSELNLTQLGGPAQVVLEIANSMNSGDLP